MEEGESNESEHYLGRNFNIVVQCSIKFTNQCSIYGPYERIIKLLSL